MDLFHEFRVKWCWYTFVYTNRRLWDWSMLSLTTELDFVDKEGSKQSSRRLHFPVRLQILCWIVVDGTVCK